MAVHSFDLGEVVTVFQMSPAHGLMIEGRALVIDLVDDVDEQYIVRFRNDEGEYLSADDCPTYERFLDREGSNHENPQQYVREFNKRIGKASRDLPTRKRAALDAINQFVADELD